MYASLAYARLALEGARVSWKFDAEDRKLKGVFAAVWVTAEEIGGKVVQEYAVTGTATVMLPSAVTAMEQIVVHVVRFGDILKVSTPEKHAYVGVAARDDVGQPAPEIARTLADCKKKSCVPAERLPTPGAQKVSLIMLDTENSPVSAVEEAWLQVPEYIAELQVDESAQEPPTATPMLPSTLTEMLHIMAHPGVVEIWNVFACELHAYMGVVTRVAALVGHPEPPYPRSWLPTCENRSRLPAGIVPTPLTVKTLFVSPPLTLKVLLAETPVTLKAALVHSAMSEVQYVVEPLEEARAPQGCATAAPRGQYVFVELQGLPPVADPASHDWAEGHNACAAKGVVLEAHTKPGAQRGPAVAVALPGAKQ